MCGPVGCTVVTFIDYCEECDIGHIDSTQEVFKLVAGDPGIGKQFGESILHTHTHASVGAAQSRMHPPGMCLAEPT